MYAGTTLINKLDEVRARIAEGRAALARVDHDYTVLMASADTAHVIDELVNHQVLIDPGTKQPIEEDPNEAIVFNFRLTLIDGSWRVTLIDRVEA